MKRLWFIFALFIGTPCLATPALSYTPNPAVYQVSPGGVVDLGATLANAGNATLYINSVSVSFNGSAASYLRQNPFFNFFNAVPGTFQTTDPVFTGNLAELQVDAASPAGTYVVNVELIGGSSPSLTDPVNNAIGTQAFSIVVEPSSSTGPPSITTPSPLPSATVGIAYSQALSATGGTGSYSTWTVTTGNLPPGLSLNPSTGVISGTPLAIAGLFNFSVGFRDSAGAPGSGTMQLAILSPASTGTPARIGGMAQIASGGGWKTAITLINPSSAAVTGQVNFYGNNGNPLTLPISFPQFDLSSSTASQTFTLTPNESLVIQTGGIGGTINVGWTDVQATGPLVGYSIFAVSVPGAPDSEGTVPLDNAISSSLSLPYDNTNGYRTGLALANQSSSAASITATLFDQNGAQVGSTPVSLPPFGHTALFLDQLFEPSQNQLGLVRFQGTGPITGVGLRFSPSGSFTSIPILP